MGGEEPPKEPVIFQKPFTSIFLVDKPQILKLPELGHEIHHEIEVIIYTINIKAWFYD